MTKRDQPSPNENLAPSVSTLETPAKRARVSSAEEEEEAEEEVPEGPIQVAGRVASVKLQNFMCHSHLLIEFNTKKNNCFYIGGPNGSGKSALFAAINLGLGGRGSDNDRGSTVKSYIKDGTSQAKITITLTNEGLNSHPGMGELISVERTINQTSSTYVLKSVHESSSGRRIEKVVSKKKGDVDRIIERFNIHLQNPAFWMSQDRSRSFLANFKPSNVYKLYLESTNLEKIRLALLRFTVSINECDRLVQEKIKAMAEESKKLKRMQEQRLLQQRVEEERALIRAYNWKLIFCRLRDYDDNIKLHAKKMELHFKVLGEEKEKYAQNRASRTAVEAEAQELKEEVQVHKEQMDEMNLEYELVKKEIVEWEAKMKMTYASVRDKKDHLNYIQTTIKSGQDELRRVMEQQGSDELKQKLKDAEKEMEEVNEKIEKMETGGVEAELEAKLGGVMNETKKNDEERYQVKRKIGELDRDIRKGQETLKRARAMKKDTINKFGPYMSEILNQIQRQRSQFQQVPKGPLGKYISITDPKWAYAIEECIRSMASTFMCSTQKDARMLQKIFDQLQIPSKDRPTIIICKFLGKAHSRLEEPSPEYNTIYRQLKFTDPDVHNIVIDKSSCETILLLENKTEAIEIMGSDNPPRNATKAYTPDGSLAYAGGRVGQYRIYSGRNGQARGIFGAATETVNEAELARDLEAKKIQMEQLEKIELRKLESEWQLLRKEEHKAREKVAEFEKKLASLRRKHLMNKRLIKDLEKEVADAATEDTLESISTGIEERQKKIPEILEEIRVVEAEFIETKKVVEELKKKREAKDVGRREMNEEVQEYHNRAQEIQKRLTAFDQVGDVMSIRIHKLQESEDELYKTEGKLKTHRDEAAANLEIEKEGAVMPPGETDPPDLTDFPPSDIARKKSEEMQRNIDRASIQVDEVVTNEYVKEFKEKMKMKRFLCRLLAEHVESLKEVQQFRLDSYPFLRQFTEKKVCEKFRELLEMRGNFIGGLDFDHDKQTLNVNVQSCKDSNGTVNKQGKSNDKNQEEDSDSDSDSEDDEPRKKKSKAQDETSKKKKGRDLKGLSGGERSFVTAALVMSLWEVMEQPFRMMDEFDVFMDMINRKLVMDLLVELATKKFPYNQFIFFTPQGIKELKKVDGLQVFEMNKVRD